MSSLEAAGRQEEWKAAEAELMVGEGLSEARATRVDLAEVGSRAVSWVEDSAEALTGVRVGKLGKAGSLVA